MAARNVVEKCTDGVEGENVQDKPRICKNEYDNHINNLQPQYKQNF